MTANRWNSGTFKAVDDDLTSKGQGGFQYSKTVIASGGDITDYMNPRIGGKRVSRNLPGITKTPVAFAIDITGSGGIVPEVVRTDLPQFMGLCTMQKADLFPDIMFSFFGDARTDEYIAQASQFESGAEEILKTLTQSVIYSGGGGGGGQGTESYTEHLWWLANRTELDVWQNGGRGTLILIGDELPYDRAHASYLNKYWLGAEDQVNQDIPLQTVIQQVQKKWNVYYIICKHDRSQYYDDPNVAGTWRTLLGAENVIKLPDPQDISEMSASLILYANGMSLDFIQGALETIGENRAIDAVTTALVAIGASGSNNKIVKKDSKKREIRRF